ncbi:2641_t:CDS:2, partial [Acaulospora colombiana]
KSSLTIQFVENHFVDSYYPTIENTFNKVIRYRGQEIAADIIDTAGQDEYSILNSTHAVGIHGYILVYSVTSRQSFEMIKIIRDKILAYMGTDWVPIVLVGNKTDLHLQRQLTSEEGKELATQWNCAWTEASAKHNENITGKMQGLVDYDSSNSEDDNEINDVYVADKNNKNENERRIEDKVRGSLAYYVSSPYHLPVIKKMLVPILESSSTKKLPPLPPEFLNLYQDKKYIENPELHQGRIRTKPHVEGNWATHVYVEVTLPDEFVDLICKIKTCAQNIVGDGINVYSCIEDSDKEDSKLHISLTRPIFLKYFQIEKFWDGLRKGFENRKR